MKRKFKLKSKLSMSLLLVAAIVFSQCQKEGYGEIAPSVISSSDKISAVTTATVSGTINVSQAKNDEGFAYKLNQDLKAPGDSPSQLTISKIKIFENGKEIGPAHATHNDIRKSGKGRFSHWGSTLYFSASDNTNPKTNGRKYTYATESTTGTVTTPGTPTPAPPVTTPPVTNPPVSTSGLLGYANVDGTTTGGKGGQTVTVSTLSALKSAVSSSSPMTIYVSGTISGSGSINVKSNKSIIGLKGATLNGVGIKVYNASNVIIQNMKIQNVLAGSDDNDCINIKYSHHIWIDHCDLSSDRTHGWEYWDGLLDITRESNYVTVSWSKIHDSHMGTLVGGGLGGHESDKGKLKVTFHHNYFYNLSERAPDMKYGYVHMFNNYFVNNSGYSIAALAGGTVRTDNNYFSNCSKPITTSYNGLAAGYVSGASTNTYVSSGSRNITTSESTWVPTYEYKSQLLAASAVPTAVTNGAGQK